MKYISINNFSRKQHYKERSPIWIKLYREELNDKKFLELTEPQRFQLWALGILASECGNKIPLDAKYLRIRLRINHALNLKPFVRLDLITIHDELPLPPTAQCWNFLLNYLTMHKTQHGWARDTPELHPALTASLRAIGGWTRIEALDYKTPEEQTTARREFCATLERIRT